MDPNNIWQSDIHLLVCKKRLYLDLFEQIIETT